MSRIIDLGKALGPVPLELTGVGSRTILYYGYASSGAYTYTIAGNQATGSMNFDVSVVGSSLVTRSTRADTLGTTGTALIIPSTGTYRVTATIPCIVATNSTGSGNIQLGLFVNGAVNAVLGAGYVSTATGTASSDVFISGSALRSFNGSDYVEVGVINSSSAPLLYNVNPVATRPTASFMLERVSI